MFQRLVLLSVFSIGWACAQVPIPNTPTGETLRAWLDAFNSGDHGQIETYVKNVDPSQSVDGMVSFRNQTGGFELLSIESSELLHIRFRIKEKGGPTTALGNLLVKGGPPATVQTFGIRALPPGAVLENIAMDAAERQKVIEGADGDLKEYYIEPATAQQMADALRCTRPRAIMMRSQMAMHLLRD
jgi:hypothetical protein